MSQTNTRTYPTRPRWLKVLLDIWENRARTILVVASITVGVFAVGMIISAYNIIETDMTTSYMASNPANIEINTTPFDDDFVTTIEKLPGVKEAEGRFFTNLRISQDGGQTWRGLQLVGVDDFEKSSIFTRELIEGTNVPNDREMLIESRVLEDFDVAVGDQLLIQLSNGTLREVPVTGIVRDQSIRGGPNSPAVAYVSLDTLTWLGQNGSLNQILAVVEGDGNDKAYVNAVSITVEDRIEKNGGIIFRSLTNLSNEHPSSTTVLAILSVLGVLGVMMLILGGSLIANTLTALINQQMRQIGVMKLVGARSLQVVGMYLVLIIALGMLSLIISIPLGAWGGYGFALFFGNLLSVSIAGFRFIPIAIVVQVGIALLIPIIAAIGPVMIGARKSVEEAISDTATDTGSARWFDTLGESVEWISRPLLISIRNTFRNIRRLLLTLFTLTFAGAIFIAVFNMQSSLQSFIGSVGDLFLADVTIDLARPYRADQIDALVRELPEVERTEAWLTSVGESPKPVAAGAEEENVILTMLGLPAGSDLAIPNIKEGRLMTAADAGTNRLVVAESIWRDLPDLKAGDSIMVEVGGNRAEPWTVVGIFAFPSPDESDPLLAYVPYDTLALETNMRGMATQFKVVTGETTLAAQTAVSDQLDVLLQNRDIQVSNVEPGLTTSETISDAISTLITFFLMMAVLTAIVGSIGLAGTMSMNVMERIREIGILRAIGAVDSAVMGSVMIEGLFIGFISWLLGIVFSFPISSALLTMVSLSITDSLMPLKLSPTGFWLWLVVILVLATLASIIPARNASRLTIREVLAYE